MISLHPEQQYQQQPHHHRPVGHQRADRHPISQRTSRSGSRWHRFYGTIIGAIRLVVWPLALAIVMVAWVPASAGAETAPNLSKHPSTHQVLFTGAAATDEPTKHSTTETEPAAEQTNWRWPVAAAPRVVAPFQPPEKAWLSGHRGIDIPAGFNTSVIAPASGFIAFSGFIVNRAVLTVDVGDGLVLTLEPVQTTLPAGSVVTRGQIIGVVSYGGHSEPGTLHIGVRRNGEYLNPMKFFGPLPRAILLPLEK